VDLPTGRDLSETVEELSLKVRSYRRERLDQYLLRKLGWSSRTKVQKLISLGRVAVNDRPGKPALRLLRGDLVRIELLVESSRREVHAPLSPPLWEDPFLFTIAKPPGQLVHPTGKTISGTVIDELHLRYRELNQRGQRSIVPRLCHRLDRDTSGLLLVAKTLELRRAMQMEFEADRVRKGYLAIVEGELTDPLFEVDAPIVDAIDRQREHSNRLSRIDQEGRPSLTRFRVLGRGAGLSVVHCRPVTGRQNQIRVHLASTGYPILGDRGYGSDPEQIELADGVDFPDRALLHSLQLRFRHPVWGTERELRCAPHSDLWPFLKQAGIDSSSLDPL